MSVLQDLVSMGAVSHGALICASTCVWRTGQAPYTCNLGVLSKLHRLRSLDFAVTAQLRLPLSVKLVSTLALAWPNLTVSGVLVKAGADC